MSATLYQNVEVSLLHLKSAAQAGRVVSFLYEDNSRIEVSFKRPTDAHEFFDQHGQYLIGNPNLDAINTSLAIGVQWLMPNA